MLDALLAEYASIGDDDGVKRVEWEDRVCKLIADLDSENKLIQVSLSHSHSLIDLSLIHCTRRQADDALRRLRDILPAESSILSTIRHMHIGRERSHVDEVVAMMRCADPAWQLVRDKDGIRVTWRSVSWSPMQCVRLEGRVDASVVSVLSVLCELDLLHTWVPHLREAQQLARPDPMRIIGHGAIRVPIVSDRDLVGYGYGCDCLDEYGTLLVCGWSCEAYELHMFRDSEELMRQATTIPPPASSTVRMEMPIGG